MSVERNLPIVRERKLAILAGDPERVAEQKKLSKLTARERITLLFDEASFVELDALVGRAGESGIVTGYGLVEERPVYVYAQDFTVMGGALGAEQARKILKVMDLARKTGAPVVAMFDSMGARLKEGLDALAAYAQIAAKTASLSGVVPQVALVLGQCAASTASIAALNDFVIVSEAGRVFMNGPQVVSANTGVQVDAKALGGAETADRLGLAHLTAKADNEAVFYARKLLALLPGNNLEDAPVAYAQTDDVNREIPAFSALDTVEDIKTVMASVADAGSLLELSAGFAPEMVTALAQMGGRTVGFVGTQPKRNGGALTAFGCEKAARFARLLDCYNIPLVTFVDTTGVSVARAEDQGRFVRASSQLIAALSDATNAKIALILGNAIAAGYTTLASREVADMVYAWPGSVIAALPVPAAVQVLMRDRLAGAANAQEKRAALEEEYARDVADGLNACKLGYVDDMIEPAETRMMLAAAIEMLASKRDARLPKKHSNLPL